MENDHEDWLELWDYELNCCSPKDVGYGSGKKYWFKCPRNIHDSELKNLNDLTSNKSMQCNQCESFGQWCLDNDRKDWLDLWDYKLNGCNPFEIAKRSIKKYWFKCPKGIHKSEKKSISNLTYKRADLKCNQCNSFGQYIIDTYGENALEKYWDYEKNKVNPFEIAKHYNNKVWIKCQDTEYHGSYEISCANFSYNQRCPYCSHKGNKIHPKDSFGQLLIDKYGKLEVVWDFEKNGNLDPFELYPQSSKKVWLFCLKKDYHGSYEIRCHDFTYGNRCPYCSTKRGKVHPKDSFAQYHIDNTDKDFVEKYWSDKNILDPFTITKYSRKKIWMCCQNNKKHKDYETDCASFTSNHRCPKCNESHGEREVSKWLDNKNIKYIREKTFNDLLGLGNEPLRYDFYLPKYNFLIEYQGSQHESPQDYFGGKEKFIEQQEHDKRKRVYAENHNIKLLEIWYWDFDNIETILNENIK